MRDSLFYAFNSPLLAVKCNIIWPRHVDEVPEKRYPNQRRNKQEIGSETVIDKIK